MGEGLMKREVRFPAVTPTLPGTDYLTGTSVDSRASIKEHKEEIHGAEQPSH